jgi:hypothetical protein
MGTLYRHVGKVCKSPLPGFDVNHKVPTDARGTSDTGDLLLRQLVFSASSCISR